MVEAIDGTVADAVRGTDVLCLIAERPAPKSPPAPLIVVPRVGPLPHVARHIQMTVGPDTGRVASNGRCLPDIRIEVGAALIRTTLTPWKQLAVRTARSRFPTPILWASAAPPIYSIARHRPS